jgi:succinoglycan biosynthesis transport protein ExoP
MLQTQSTEPRSAGGGTPRFSSRPADQRSPAAASPFGRELTAIGLLTSLRRRWVSALMVGIPAALLACAAVWELIPARYESSAVLKIQQFEQMLSFDTKERHADFLTYRDTQKAFIKSRGVITSALRNPLLADCPTLREIDYPVEWLMQELSVDEQTSDEFLKISLEGENPEDLALIVNAVKDAYMDEVVYNERNDRIEQLRKLEKSFTTIDQRVRAAQNSIDLLAENLGTGDSKIAVLNQGLIQQQLMDLQKGLREINGHIIAEEAAHQSLTEQGLPADTQAMDGLMGVATALTTSPASTGSATIGNTLQRELISVRQQIARFRQQLRNPDHPDLQPLLEQEQMLVTMITGVAPSKAGTPGAAGTASASRLDWFRRQKSKLEAEISDLKKELNAQGRKIVELEREKRNIEQDVKTREELASEIARREVELNAPERISVVQDANVPEKREIKKKTQLSALAAMAVLGCCVLGFTLFEWFSYRVGAATDISGEVDLRVVGTIPSPDSGGLLGLGIFAGSVDYEEWNRAVTESMDVVRTFLMRHIDPSRPASILITSASANEGKTTVSCQLAASLARTGKRVAIVDCDFRRPSAHEMLDGQPGPGLSEYLRGELPLQQICQETQSPGLTFIPAGQVDQQVLQELACDGGRTLIQQLKSQFDFVIIDTSPLLFVAEPSMLAQNADIVLLASRKDYSRVPYVIQARESLRSLQVPLLGAIMVGADSDFQRQTYGYQQNVTQPAG